MRFRTLLFIVVIVVLAVVNGWSQSERNVNLTVGFNNGRAWRNLSSIQNKVTFLVAYRDGLAYGMMIGKRAAMDLNKEMPTMYPEMLTWEETAASLDRFYEAPENRRIIIPQALQIVTLQNIGASKEEVEKTIESFRQPLPPN